MNIITKKMEKLREVNFLLNKRICDLETYVFIENIMDVNVIRVKNNKIKSLSNIK